MTSPGATALDLIIDDDSYEQGTLKLLSVIRPLWKPDDIVFKVFTEGITNKLFRVMRNDDTSLQDAIVVRLYGKKTELIIDRDAEKKNMQILHAFGCSSPLIATFTNGIAYGFVTGECLDEKSVRDSHIGSLIAAEMVRMHQVNSSKMKALGLTTEIDTRPFIFRKAREYLDLAPESFENPKKNEKLLRDIRSKSELWTELDILEKHLMSLNSPVVFCHNDLLLKNIVYNKELDRVYFIDFEYGAFDFEAFDIGDHFCEWAGVDTVDYSLYPDKVTQYCWLKHYLEHRFKAEEKDPGSITENDLETLYVQVNKFALMANFFWGVWALIQSKHSTIDFDYLDYAVLRFGEYFAKKDQFFALKMP